MYGGRSSDAMEPMVFGILRGLTPPEHECVLFDERLEEIPLDDETDLVAITVETFTARRSYQIASEYVKRGVPVVMGGYHATFCPQEALQFANSVVVGESELAWPQILRDASRGEMQRVYKGQLAGLDEVTIDRSIFAGKKYRPIKLVQFGRGCKYACDFCSIHAFYGNNLRWRNVDQIVEELSTSKRPFVFLIDDNLFNDRERLKELLKAIRPLRIHWNCQASIDVAADQELVQLMADSGCLSVLVGFESLVEQNLKQMKKSWQRKYGTFDDLVQVFRDHGIMVYGTFVLGYDHDTPDSFKITLDFALRNKFFLANFNPLAPTPGARLYDRLKSEGRLIRDPWWLDPDFRYGDTMFQPRGMTPDQLKEGCYWARTEFNRATNILRRATDFRANLRSPLHAAAFALSNFTSRKEIHSKQGRSLGVEGLELQPMFEPDAGSEERVCIG